MRHSHHLEGFAFGLRPVDISDAEFILEVRTKDPARLRFLHSIPADVQQQRDWITRYFDRENDYYWVVERLDTHEREGLLGIYDVNSSDGTAEWGRWVLRPGSLAAVESAWLVYRAAFEQLNLKSVCCITVAGNLPVLSFHDSCGLSRLALLNGQLKLSDGDHDGVKHICDRESWLLVQSRLEPQARLIARRIRPGT